MKKTLTVFLLFSTICLVGCASLFNNSPSLLQVLTSPSEAKITIKGVQNNELVTKTSPCTVYLNKASDYQVDIELAGYKSDAIIIRRTISGWFWGNLLLGGIVGMVIDYGTSNMWEHAPVKIDVDLEKNELFTGQV